MELKNEKLMIAEQKRNIRQIRWLIFWVMISLNVVTLTIESIFTFMDQTVILDYTRMMVTHILAVLLPLIIYFKISGINPEKISLRLNKFSFLQALIIMLLAIAGQFIIAIPIIPIQLQLGVPTSFAPIGVTEILMGFMAITIIPAVLEEVLFRGVLFGGMERQSTMLAVVFSSFVFALLHANILNFFGYVFLGLMTVMVMLRTNSIYAAIFYHFIFNLTAFILGVTASQIPLSVSFIVWLFLSSVVVFIVSIFIFRLLTPNAQKYRSKKTGSLLLSNIFSIPIILCIIITIVIQYFRFIV